jgi:dipeptidyl-peptidase-4
VKTYRVTILCLLFLTVSLFAQDHASQTASTPTGQQPLTIEAIFADGGITGRAPEAVKWSPDGTKVSYVQRDDSGERGALYYIDLATGKPAVLVSAEKLSSLAPSSSSIKDERQKEAMQRYSIAAYHWSPDSKHLLFDSLGQLWLYSLDTGTAVQVTTSADAVSDPKFSPDGERVAYVRKHDLYVRDIKRGQEEAITRTGNDNLLNGEVDWVYLEELYTRSNYFWSPDGRSIAYLEMNEKDVPLYPITDWIPTHPTVDMEKYPKAGDPNPVVRIGIVPSGGGKVKWISGGGKDGDLPLGNDPNVLIPRFGWVRDGILWAMALNRVQDRLDIYFIDTQSGKSKRVLTEKTDAWIDMHPEIDFESLSSGDRFLWTSWRDGHYHIYLYQFDKQNPLAGEAKLVSQLTKGDWEVEAIDGVDESAGVVYFTANEGDWRQANVYSVGLDGANFHRISKENGTHGPNFGPAKTKSYVDNYSALTTPPSLSLCTTQGACAPFWQARSVEAYHLSAPKQVEFKAADGTTILLGSLLLPEGGPMMANGKAPLIVNPYGGPGIQYVRDAWGGERQLFDQILVRQGFAILKVDNRGMANRGEAFAVPIKNHLGPVEFDDQMAAIKQALQQYSQLDGSRMGFWGWSYGGYFTLYTMEKTDAFKAGVSVAPVTDWRNYDSIYTERYMGLPGDNEDGYRKSSPVNFAGELHGKLLEAHGTSDDNVHLQNTIQMTNSFINAGKQFQLMLYPRKTHGIAGKAARTDLFHRIEDHFEQNLGAEK